MRSFSISLMTGLMIGSLGLAGSAVACGGGNGNHGGGFTIGIGGGGYGGGSCHNNGGYVNNGGYDNNNYGQAYEPFHSSYICQPGDNFYVVSLKEYGTSAAMKYITSYNRMATNAALVPGTRLMLPSISATGRLSASRAPAAESLAAANFTQPASTTTAPTVTPVASEPERVSVPTGATLKLEGEKLGSEAGVVRLRITGVAFPVEVVEWSADSTKIRLPKLDVTEATKAELEVVRADGTLASTNPISLTTAATSVAAN